MERWVTVAEPNGLHARLAARIVQRQRSLRARVTVEYEGRRADASSLTSLLLLGVGPGVRVRLVAEGEDAREALERLGDTLERGVGGATYPGVGVAPGVGVGRALLSAEDAWGAAAPAASAPSGLEGADPEAELERLDDAIGRAESQLVALEAWARREAGDASDILRAERALLGDAAWRAPLAAAIRAGLVAEAAVRAAGEAPLPPIEEGGPRDGLREVLRDVARRLLRSLAHAERADAPRAALGPEPIVLVARRANPSELLEWPRGRLAGVAAAVGGAHAHAALIARALGVPMVVGIGDALVGALQDASGRSRPLVRVDGTYGVVTLDPPEAEAVTPPRARFIVLPRVAGGADRPALLANADTPEDVRRAREAGAEGVGLARTERLFLGREVPPTEDEQYLALRALAEECAGWPLTLRLADLGGGKTPPYLLPLLGSSAQGMRGAALLAASASLARPHLRAIARVAHDTANAAARITVMVPMVATRDEWVGILGRWREASEARGARADLSLLVETPSAALSLDELLDEADEVALGTNDLAAFLFGGDRERGEGVWRPLLQPVMLRLVRDIIARAHRRQKRVTACGDAAGELPEALVLWGLGVDALSVAPERLALVGGALRALDRDTVSGRVGALLSLEGATHVHRRLDEWRRELASRREQRSRNAGEDWLSYWE